MIEVLCNVRNVRDFIAQFGTIADVQGIGSMIKTKPKHATSWSSSFRSILSVIDHRTTALIWLRVLFFSSFVYWTWAALGRREVEDVICTNRPMRSNDEQQFVRESQRCHSFFFVGVVIVMGVAVPAIAAQQRSFYCNKPLISLTCTVLDSTHNILRYNIFFYYNIF